MGPAQLAAAEAVPDSTQPLEVGQSGSRAVNRAAAERAVADLLQALGYSPAGEPGLADTPRRVAAALAEMTRSEPFTLTTFPNKASYDEIVMVTDIPFQSLCMHHLLPFCGVAHVGYLPGERIVGLSKLARVVESFAKDLQVQENLTAQIAQCLQDNLDPRGVGVVLEAEHMCMSLRGIRKPGARTVTSSLLGLMRTDAKTRDEFLSLVKRCG